LPHQPVVDWGGQEVTSRAAVPGNETIGGAAPLRVPWGLEPLQAPFALARRPVGVLRPVLQIPVRTMSHTR
jgi:hypothetical protein